VRRLRSHSQAEQREIIRTVWVFRCNRCERLYRLLYAKPLADGSLVCRGCLRDQDAHDLRRCESCGQMLPEDEFTAPGGYADLTECRSCRAPVDLLRYCGRCGEPFTARRRDAVYCSVRCRVAAHRAKPTGPPGTMPHS
jgi:hypothetical protein